MLRHRPTAAVWTVVVRVVAVVAAALAERRLVGRGRVEADVVVVARAGELSKEIVVVATAVMVDGSVVKRRATR